MEKQFLVDTGSAIDALNIDTYNAMEFPPKLETSFYPQVFTVDNSTTETFGQFDAYIMVTDGEVTAALELPLHVMNCGDSQGILGRPFMTKYNMQLDIKHSLVTLTIGEVKVTMSINELDSDTR